MKLTCHASTGIQPGVAFEPATPLWSRVPTRDDAGHLLGDFMMLIPRLRDRPAPVVAQTTQRIVCVLHARPEVVFADLNLALNLLWISLHPRPHAIIQVATAIRAAVPEAVLIAHHIPPSS